MGRQARCQFIHLAHTKKKCAGYVWEYNDVRVNALALAATSVWRKPLPQVLKQYIMDPIGASNTWRWTGYRNAWIVLDGQAVQSVSGGGHWGGGMFINAYDMARYGLLTLHRGNWNGKQLLSEQWIKQSLNFNNGQYKLWLHELVPQLR
jgi:CubicO group peptidase (beta-lactamase class C family)